MALKIYNTLTKKKEDFIPIQESKVKIYVCGPTVYNYFHIGNARPFIVFDAFRHFLEYLGYQVTYVQNITDIEDKIIKAANEENVSTTEIASKYTKAFFEDIEKLGIRKADYYPKASAFVKEMIELIKILMEKDYVYESGGDVYMSIEKVADYGKLSGKSIDDLQVGARVEKNEAKRNPLDFVLWKKAKPNEPFWESPWGNGRPGWHTECVVMSQHYLGTPFDIHCGGIDLVFPHHENEIAQAESASGKKFVNYWLHNEYLNVKGEKMSKSLGNFFTAREILKRFDGEVIRMFFLSKHYRSPIDFSERQMIEAQRSLENLYHSLRLTYFSPDKGFEETEEFKKIFSEYEQKFISALEDDFNTASALAVLFKINREIKRIFSQDKKLTGQKKQYAYLLAVSLYKLGKIIGFFNRKEKFQKNIDKDLEGLLDLLIKIREELRMRKDWELADKIRVGLKKVGIGLIDKKDGTEWELI